MVAESRSAAVRRAIDAYHALVAADPRAAFEQSQRLVDDSRTAGITFAGAPMPTLLRPQFVSRADADALRADARRFVELAARMARNAFGGDPARLCAFLGTPEAETPWVVLDPGPPDVAISRVDAFLTGAGPRFIEINSDAPAGFGYSDRLARVFQALPLFRSFAAHTPVSHRWSEEGLVRAVLAPLRERSGDRLRIAIVDWAEVNTRADQEILREAFAARGHDCRLVDPREMEIHAGRLCSKDGPVDLVYRRTVLSEVVEKEDEVRPFLRAYRDRLCPFVNSLRCLLSEDKAFFALLTDENFAALTTAEERAFLSRLAPWTRKVEERHTQRDGRRIDLVPHVLAEREGLVLKPGHAYGGRSVYVGAETPAADWEAAVRAALGGAWVVQERVFIPEEPFPVFEGGELRFSPLKVNTNPFYAAGHEVGAVTRVSRSSVINVSAGGGSVPTFVVD
jgi:hypothetical protein